MSKDLYQYSIDQLAVNRGSWPEIAERCEVSYSWLCKFANDKIPEASYRKLQRISDYMDEMARRAGKDRRMAERRTGERRSR